jgi:3-oxoacyl-[acyl-carrier protein] reductase
METGLANRTVLVTGASGGLGRAIVRAFAAEKTRTIVHFASHPEPALELVREIGESSACALAADLRDEEQARRLFADAEARFGPLDILIANAGVWPAQSVPLCDLSLARWKDTLDTDLTSIFLSLREFLAGVRRARLVDPAIVLIGSTAGIFGEAGHADYAAAKSALSGLLLSAKNEVARLAPRGRVNMVCPGWVSTAMTRNVMTQPELVRRAMQTMSLRKLARPEDVASAVVYLASTTLAGHVTGQVLTLSGGMEGRLLYCEDEIDSAGV